MKKSVCILLVALIALSLCGCGGINYGREYAIKDELLMPQSGSADNSKVYYEIFVRSFSDGNGDGIGDFKGVINRLDYLNDGDPKSGKSLGIDGIWFMPIMKTGSYHGYDVTDYYDTNPSYGTLSEFDELVSACAERGIDVIIDLVLNHTSSYHPWFKQAKEAVRSGDLANKYVGWYSLSTAKKTSKWYEIGTTPDGVTYYYEGNFSSDMPELDYDNPEVKAEIVRIIEFWLARGVKGFRLDAVPYIYFDEHTKNIEFLKWFRAECERIDPAVYIIAECWRGQTIVEQYYEAVNCFDFILSGGEGEVAFATKEFFGVEQLTSHIQSYYDGVWGSNPNAVPAPFLSNHDQDRSAGWLSAEDGTLQMAANIYMLLPGVPYIYYGEEIGIKGSRGAASTDANRRLRMLWGDGDTVANPPGATYAESSQPKQTVREAITDGDSIYNHYKRLIMLRRANPEIANGSYTALRFDGYFSFGGALHTYNGGSVAVLHNTSELPLTIDLSLYLNGALTLRGFAGFGEATLDKTTLTIDGRTSVVIRTGP